MLNKKKQNKGNESMKYFITIYGRMVFFKFIYIYEYIETCITFVNVEMRIDQKPKEKNEVKKKINKP